MLNNPCHSQYCLGYAPVEAYAPTTGLIPLPYPQSLLYVWLVYQRLFISNSVFYIRVDTPWRSHYTANNIRSTFMNITVQTTKQLFFAFRPDTPTLPHVSNLVSKVWGWQRLRLLTEKNNMWLRTRSGQNFITSFLRRRKKGKMSKRGTSFKSALIALFSGLFDSKSYVICRSLHVVSTYLYLEVMLSFQSW